MPKRPTQREYREQGLSAGTWLRIDHRVHTSAAWLSLSGNAVIVWLRLRAMLGRANNGLLSPTYAECCRRGWRLSNDRRVAGLAELLDKGFIARTRYCGPNVFHRATLYRFTDVPAVANDQHGVAGTQATDEYLRWAPPTDAPAKRRPKPRQKKNTSSDRPTQTVRTDRTEPYGQTDDGGPKPYGQTDDGENAVSTGSARGIGENGRRPPVVGQTDIYLDLPYQGAAAPAAGAAVDVDVGPLAMPVLPAGFRVIGNHGPRCTLDDDDLGHPMGTPKVDPWLTH